MSARTMIFHKSNNYILNRLYKTREQHFSFNLTMFGLTFSSCKKYEDELALSLKSKNVRITGDWKLISYLYKRTSDEGTTTSTYDGTTMITSYGSYPYS